MSDTEQFNELAVTQQWSTIRQNQEYQRAFNEVMSVLLANPLYARELIIFMMERH